MAESVGGPVTKPGNTNVFINRTLGRGDAVWHHTPREGGASEGARTGPRQGIVVRNEPTVNLGIILIFPAEPEDEGLGAVKTVTSEGRELWVLPCIMEDTAEFRSEPLSAWPRKRSVFVLLEKEKIDLSAVSDWLKNQGYVGLVGSVDMNGPGLARTDDSAPPVGATPKIPAQDH